MLLVAATVLYAALQLRSVYRTNAQGHDWNRRKAAQDICIRYEEFNPNKTDLLKKLDYFNNNGVVTQQDLQELFEENPKHRLNAHQFLNYFEYLCVGIKQGIYDEQVIKEFWSTLMLKAFTMFKPYVIEYRSSYHQSTAWEMLEEYSVKWESEKKISDKRGNVDLT